MGTATKSHRTFDGHRYRLDDTFKNKAQAKNHAKWRRSLNNESARVVKCLGGYAVYRSD
jgi:hypothetical protein